VALLSKQQRPDPRGRETEEAFLAATRALLEEGASFAELNVSRIADRAGRTRTSFYAYFEDRRELLARLAERLAAALFVSAEEFFASGATDVGDIKRTLGEILDAFKSDRTLLRAVVEASGYDDEVAAYWRGIVDRFVDAAQKRLEQTRGAPPAEARALAFTLVWMTERSCYQHAIRGSGIEEPVLLDALADVWWRTLQAPGS
jgi:AcrR family transcriptional regulator